MGYEVRRGYELVLVGTCERDKYNMIRKRWVSSKLLEGRVRWFIVNTYEIEKHRDECTYHLLEGTGECPNGTWRVLMLYVRCGEGE